MVCGSAFDFPGLDILDFKDVTENGQYVEKTNVQAKLLLFTVFVTVTKQYHQEGNVDYPLIKLLLCR